jgi:hypothetical protein
MDPFEQYDMAFNGAMPTRATTNSAGKCAGMDNGWALSIIQAVLIEFNKSINEFPRGPATGWACD